MGLAPLNFKIRHDIQRKDNANICNISPAEKRRKIMKRERS